jgi:glutamate racemase
MADSLPVRHAVLNADPKMTSWQMHTRCSAPIGVFDSGMGGLSVVREIQAHLPHESIRYLADTANVPYGGKSDDEIRTLTAQAVDWLYQSGCKAVVVACNTASAFSLTTLRQHYGDGFPIIGLVPAVKPAVAATRTGRIGVLATPGTLRGTLLQDVIKEVATPAQVEVLTAVSPQLVPFVEQGLQCSAECLAELNRVLSPLANAGVDQLVLGCTHYPFLRDAITQVFADQFTLVDSGAAVARQTGRVLQQRGLDCPVDQSQSTIALTSSLAGAAELPARLEIYTTGSLSAAQTVVSLFVEGSFTLSLALPRR